MADYVSDYRAFAERYTGRALRARDGLPKAVVRAAELRLGLCFPKALRDYYLRTGRCDALNTVHNQLRPPLEVCVDDGFLVFMDENQSVVSWGLRVEQLHEENPVVWQRNNTPPVAWFSERKRFVAFLRGMFNWYAKCGVLPAARERQTSRR